MENARAVLAGHSTELDVPADIREVSFDFERISEVITHLLENAAKYSPKNSSIRVSVEHTPEELSLMSRTTAAGSTAWSSHSSSISSIVAASTE